LKPINKLVDNFYEKFVDEKLNTYYSDHLESEFPDFANIMDEYRDGLLLFDLMEKEIWEKSKTDTLGLQSFYNSRKMDYMWKNRLDATIASSTSNEVIKKAQKLFKQKNTPEQVKEKLNTNDKVQIMTNTGVFEEGSEALPKNLKFATGVSEILNEKEYYFVALVNKVIPAGPKDTRRM
jgi:peptidyl-prolyl cis-trans isomerase SurA